MTTMLVWLSLFLLSLPCIIGLKEIPDRARGGSAFKRETSRYTARTTSDALWFEQKMDHSGEYSNGTFKQRYFVDDTFYVHGSDAPIFFEIGGEGTLSGPPGGYMATLAKEYGALLVALEHRFYGESIPGGNSKVETLTRYLSVAQALADLNAFTLSFTQEKQLKGKWFVFGGSYPGALSSWYRNAYPDASVGSLSSSGVVNPIVDFHQFDEQVSAAIGNECGTRLKMVNAAFEKQMKTPDGFKKSKEQFQCEEDISKVDFLYMIADSWSMMDQYGAKSKLCDAILSIPEEEVSDSKLTSVFSALSNEYWGSQFCSSGFYNTNALKDESRWDTNSRSWRWQTCSELAWFNTAPVQGSIRSTKVDLSYHLNQCSQIFGYDVLPGRNVDNLIKQFGGASPRPVSNVFYSDFSDDPWQRASVSYSPNTDQPYYLATCDNCGHCMDFHEPSDSDPQPLKDERKEFEKYLRKWLS